MSYNQIARRVEVEAGDLIIETPMETDAPDLARLFLEDMDALGIKSELSAQLEFSQSVIQAARAEHARCLCWGVRLAEGGPLVGMILVNFTWSPKFAARSLWIESLYVTPSARRRGIGRVLVEQLLDWAQEQGVGGVDIEAYRGNTPASVLYRTLGFRRLGRERFVYRFE